MASIHFEITADNQQLLRKLDETARAVRRAAATVGGEASGVDALMRRVAQSAAAVGAAFSARELVDKIVQVRSEMQKLEVAFTTMLGSKEKSDALMAQMVELAATTPFDLQTVADGARRLLAYGESAERVTDDLTRLGNIAAGLSQPLTDLVYLYGTTMTQGRLYTQDFNQFTGRGIPMVRELAAVLGVAESEVRGLVEAGRIGFPEVQQVIRRLTDEGGMFYNLMAEQSKTIGGQLSNLGDSISMMFNEIGQSAEGIITGAISTAASLVDNYEQVGRTVAGLVLTYGTYRAAVMLVSAAHGLAAAGVTALTAAEAAHYGWLVIVEKAQKLLNATMLANPYVLVATLIAGVVAAMVSMKTETERLKEAEEDYQAAKQKTIEAEEEHRRRLEELCGVAGDESLATDTRREALNKLEQKYPDIFAKYDTEYEKLKNIKRIKEEIAELEAGQSITRPQNELDNVNERIAALEAKKATERWEDANGSGTRMRKVGGLTGNEATELQNLYNKRKALSEQVRKEQANAYFENLTGISNDTLEEQIRQRQNLLARMTTEQKKYGTITYGTEALRGTYSRDELQYQLNKLNAEKNRRNLKRDSSADWGAQARKEYEQALKAYNDFLADTSNSLTREDYEKKAKELKDALSLAKKEYDKYKPDENKDAESERKAADKAAREAERRRQAKEELGRELTDLERQNQEAWTAAMAEGLDKQLKQIRDAYSRRTAEIDQLEAQWSEKSREAGLEGLTSEQTAALAEARRAALEEMNQAAERARREDAERQQDEQDRQRQAWNEYLIEYGNVQEKRQAIAQKYAILIRRAETEGEKATLTRQMQDELDEFDNKVKGSTTLMAQLFADTARRSTSELDRLVDKAELLMRYLAATKDAQGTARIDGRTVTRGDILSLGVSEHTLGRLQQSAEETEALAGAIRKLRGELGSRSPFLALRTQIEDATAQMKSGDLSGGIEQMASAVEQFMPAVEQMGRELGTIFGDDRLGERIGGVADAMAGMAGVAGGVGRAMSGDVVGGTMSIVSGISTIVSALDGLWGADYSRFEAMSEQYDRLTAVWDTLIDKKREYLAESWGTEAEAAHDEAVALLREQQEAARELARQRNQSGASAGSHSIGYRQNEWIGQAADELSRYVDASRLVYGNKFAQSGIDAAGTLLSATASELEAVRENMAGLWASLDADFRSALEDIIEAEDQIAQLGESLKEQLTQVSFDSLYDSFVDTLMDMDAEAGDFAEGLTEQFMRAALSQQVGQLYQERLRGWYDRFAAAMSGDDQRLTDAEMEALRAEYQGIVDDALRLRDQLAQATGYDKLQEEAAGSTSSQTESTRGAFETMSQDTAEELSGRFTAVQIASERAASSAQQLVGVTTAQSATLQDMLSQQVMQSGYLEDIARYTRSIAQWSEKIDQLVRQTKNL